MPSPSTSSSIRSIYGPFGTDTKALAINSLLSGVMWGSSTESWINPYISGTTLTYSFPWATTNNATFSGLNGSSYSSQNENTADTRYGFNINQQTAARKAMEAWANVANIKFIEVSDTSTNVGDIRFAFSSAVSESAWGHAYHPSKWPSGGDIWISSKYGSDKDWSVGTVNFESLMHEIGHSLGLKHPFEDGDELNSSLDNLINTIMSYTDINDVYPSAGYVSGKYDWLTYFVNRETPMVFDVAAIQYIYGPNNTYKTGNDSYTFDPTKPFFKTIWDAGGVDTISVSNFALDCLIDLTPGSYSSIRYPRPSDTAGVTVTYDGTNNLGIAFNCTIENAIGGSGSDRLIGNVVNNQFRGNGGEDYLDGQGGIDTALFSGLRSGYTLSKINNNQWKILDNTANRDGTDTLVNIERIKFSDGNLAIDIGSNQNAGSLYMLYKAAFNRAPDVGGMGYWLAQVDGGKNIVTDIAKGFVNAPEFIAKYGTNPTNAFYVDQLYKNVLGRTGEAGGVAYWNQQLDKGSMTKAYVLQQFSALPEGVALVANLIANGIAYQEWVG